jgi:hypothetical protein
MEQRLWQPGALNLIEEAYTYRNTENFAALGLTHAAAGGAVQLRAREHTRGDELDREARRKLKKAEAARSLVSGDTIPRNAPSGGGGRRWARGGPRPAAGRRRAARRRRGGRAGAPPPPAALRGAGTGSCLRAAAAGPFPRGWRGVRARLREAGRARLGHAAGEVVPEVAAAAWVGAAPPASGSVGVWTLGNGMAAHCSRRRRLSWALVSFLFLLRKRSDEKHVPGWTFV